MFERMTDRSRRTIVLAGEAAGKLGHELIGTEHLLIGLAREAEGVAALVLAVFGVDAEKIVAHTVGIVGQGDPGASPPKAFTPRCHKVLELSLREALQLGHNYIGTEHMLLALIREGEGVAAHVLAALGVDLADARQAVIARLAGYEAAAPTGPRRPCTGCHGVGTVPTEGTLRRFGARIDCPRCKGSEVDQGSVALPTKHDVGAYLSRLRDEAAKHGAQRADRLSLLERTLQTLVGDGGAVIIVPRPRRDGDVKSHAEEPPAT